MSLARFNHDPKARAHHATLLERGWRLRRVHPFVRVETVEAARAILACGHVWSPLEDIAWPPEDEVLCYDCATVPVYTYTLSPRATECPVCAWTRTGHTTFGRRETPHLHRLDRGTDVFWFL